MLSANSHGNITCGPDFESKVSSAFDAYKANAAKITAAKRPPRVTEPRVPELVVRTDGLAVALTVPLLADVATARVVAA